MKSIIRRIAAVLLCAMLALAVLPAAAQDLSALAAQVVGTLEDGSPFYAGAEPVVTTLGDTVFWVDMSVYAPEEVAALMNGRLVLTDEMGATLAEIPLWGATQDVPAQLSDSTGATY